MRGRLVPRLRRSAGAAAALDGVNAASVSLIAVVCCQLEPPPSWTCRRPCWRRQAWWRCPGTVVHPLWLLGSGVVVGVASLVK